MSLVVNPYTLGEVLASVREERYRQAKKFPRDYDHRKDGTGLPNDTAVADYAKLIVDSLAAKGKGIVTWRDILHEEVCEAFAETDPVKLREELIQVAAVAVAWVETLERRIATID